MARADTTERITASPSAVWRWFTPEQMQKWYGPQIELLSPGPLGKGSRIRVSGRGRAQARGYEATVTEYASNRALTWEGADSRASYRIAFLLTPKEGGTLILLKDEFHLKGLLGRLIERLFMLGRVAKADRYFLSRLKTLAEG